MENHEERGKEERGGTRGWTGKVDKQDAIAYMNVREEVEEEDEEEDDYA